MVYKGIWNNLEVAVKTIVFEDEGGDSIRRKQHAILEAAITTSMAHSNVVRSYAYTIEVCSTVARPYWLSNCMRRVDSGCELMPCTASAQVLRQEDPRLRSRASITACRVL